MKIWKFSASGLLRGAVAAAFAGAVVLGLALPAQASLLDDQVTLDSRFNSFVCPDPVGPDFIPSCLDPVTVVAGTEFTAGDGTGIGTALVPIPGSFIDIGASSITFFIPNLNFLATWNLLDMDWLPDPGIITGLSLDPASDPLVQLTTSFINGVDGSSVQIQLNCQFAPCTGGTFIVNFATEHAVNGVPVPEPASVTLFGAGLGMLGLMVTMRRRRQAA